MHPTIASINRSSESYPNLLREVSDAPETLFYRGRFPDDSSSCIAVVGTRKATREGLAAARRIARELAERGLSIVSGLAFGIDAAAHGGALEGNGRTFAVLANGLDEIYPREHESLAQSILSSGAGGILSEYPAGTPALPHQFLARNRIISGLSIATVIVEAPAHSGALATARLALEQGREVFVCPGPAYNRNYEGSNRLLRTGARLVTSTEDILEDLEAIAPACTPAFAPPSRENLDDVEKCIFKTLTNERRALTVDEIADLTKLEPWIINQKLSFLLVKGVIAEAGRNAFILRQIL